ncbi:MAG: 50S ribosomal protein L11 methyltransferase [Holophagaceae bacterium]|nr:50S ribosomal protein L11 methyltransferase [Holophagaceae bacterium]
MLPFDVSAGPQGLARTLLTVADPLPALEGWLDQGAGRLAPVLHALVAELAGGPTPSPLSHAPLEVSLGDHKVKLELLLLPSIFAPEAWSFTFLEGLLRKPGTFYRGKRVVELGTGSGFISLALLSFTEIERILGVDLNPQAILMARLNAILNGFDAEGREAPNRLHTRFEASISDLLRAPREHGFAADLVIGCIPPGHLPGGGSGFHPGPL